MAFEIPSELIREFRAGLRREAGFPEYDPSDPNIPPLPSIPDAVASLDPSLPSYLRCHRCRGGLLRGLQSTICVYCGAEQRREGFTQSISFRSTAACRGFLEALELDGSETVASDNEASKSSKGHNLHKDGLVLSDLLDLEISWPPVKKESDNISTTKVPSQTTYALNLSGVDLDTFFTDTKKETTSIASIAPAEQLITERHIAAPEMHSISGSEEYDFFENIQSMATSSLTSKDREFGDSSADWEADFQSASCEPTVTGSESADLFQNFPPTETANPTGASAKIDWPTEIENVGSIKAGSEEPTNEKSQPSSIGDWIQDDIGGHTNKNVADAADQFKIVSETRDVEPKDDLKNISSISDSWGQDDLWFTGGTMESKKIENIKDDDDAYDDWQDFTSSAKAPEGPSNSQTQIDSSSGAQGGQKGSVGVEDIQVAASALDRMNGLNEKTDADDAILEAPGTYGNFCTDSNLDSPSANVEMLLSQMPDLSFMLKSELSIPKKPERSD